MITKMVYFYITLFYLRMVYANQKDMFELKYMNKRSDFMNHDELSQVSANLFDIIDYVM